MIKRFFAITNQIPYRKPFLLTLVILVMPMILLAQQYGIKDFGVQKELGNSNIRKIFQDKIGVIWLGTENGLARFNGQTITLLNAPDSVDQIPVSSIFQDMNQRLWVGYQNGKLAYYNSNKELEMYEWSGDTLTAAITGIYLDPENVLWIATYGQGLFYLSDHRSGVVNFNNGLIDDYIYTMAEGPDGKIWVGTDRGVSIASLASDTINLNHLTMNDGLMDNIVKVIEPDQNGKFIIGFYENGFCWFDFNQQKIVSDSTLQWDYGIINDIAFMNEKEIMLATERNGIFKYHLESHELSRVFNHSDSEKIWCIENDSEGNIWISDDQSNLQILDPRFTFHAKPIEDLALKTFDSDKFGKIWYPGKGKIYSYIHNSPDSLRVVELNIPSLPDHEKIISSFIDEFGYLWLGTCESGVYRINPTNGASINLTEANGLVNNNVLSINGSGNEIWFATLGGVSRCHLSTPRQFYNYSGFDFQNFDQEDGLGTNYIYQVFIDSKKQAWFATHGRGIAVFKNDELIDFDDIPEIASEVVYSITEDQEGNIWFSTANGSIFRYDGTRFENLTSYLGNDQHPISGIISDLRGNIIIEFIDGVGLLDRDMNYFNLTNKITPYTLNGELNVIRHDQQGNIWIAADQGLIRFSHHNTSFQHLPETFIESIEVFFQDIDIQEYPELRYDQNHISFICHSNWYQDAEDISYEYMLTGYDLDWQDSKDHIFTYPKLPPGKYTFQVRSAVNNKNLQSNVAKFDFTIKSPIWFRPWFYLSLLVIIGLVLYKYIKVRERRLKHAERLEKEVIEFQFETLKSQVNPHFLFNSFNTLMAIIEDNQAVAVEYVSKLSDFFRNVLTYRNIQVIDLEEEIKLIRDYYFLQQKRYGDNFELKIDLSEKVRDTYIPPMTLQLLTENALKHNVVSRKKPILIEIFDDGDQIVVKNNMHPKSPDPNSTGMGLENIKSRYKLLTDKPIEIIDDNSHFLVKLPILIKTQ